MAVLARLSFLLWAAFMGLIFGGFIGLVVGFVLDVALAPSGMSFAWAGAYLGAALGLCLGIIGMGAKLARDG
jgi:hypothetical protein